VKVLILRFLLATFIFSFLGPKISVVAPISSAVTSVFLPQYEVKDIIIIIIIIIIITIIRKVLFNVLWAR
jgi:hypothetical protein